MQASVGGRGGRKCVVWISNIRELRRCGGGLHVTDIGVAAAGDWLNRAAMVQLSRVRERPAFLVDAAVHVCKKLAVMTQQLLHQVIVRARQLIDEEAG